MSSYSAYILISLSLVFIGRIASHTNGFYERMNKFAEEHGLLEDDDDVFANELEKQYATPPPRPKEVENWPQVKLPRLGEVSGVTINRVGQPVIFHRGSRSFNEWSFNETNDFQFIKEGPIDIDTILTLDPKTGKVLSSWGRGFFYLPHGITIDHEGNTWLTDIAMHQVFKFSLGSSRPSMSFGQKFKHGSGVSKLCMPTSVAVAHNGDIFIADGYCNSRVLKFNHRGDLVRLFPQQWGEPECNLDHHFEWIKSEDIFTEFLSLQVPHSLALMEQYDMLCIADRENMRVTCIRAELDNYDSEVQAPSLNIQQPDLGRVFAIAAHKDYIYAINGPTSPMIAIQGFTLSPLDESIVDHWDSFAKKMSMPHDIAITEDGRELYIVSVTPSRILKFSLDWQKRKT